LGLSVKELAAVFPATLQSGIKITAAAFPIIITVPTAKRRARKIGKTPTVVMPSLFLVSSNIFL